MLQRLALLVAAVLVGFMAIGATTAPTMRIRSFSAGPSTGSEAFGRLKGTARFRISGDRSDRTLEAYGNGNGSGRYQCVELIKRYGSKLGLSNFPSARLPSVGNGYQAAEKFAKLSGGAFVYVPNGARTLPKPGAVISIEDWRTSSGQSIGGHVGIVMNYTEPSRRATSVTFSIFEQNMPTPSWKTITFNKSGRTWSGYMLNNSQRRYVKGWANPR